MRRWVVFAGIFPGSGFPQTFTSPPVISDAYDNGKRIQYRPADANRRPYSHQWNITVDHQLGRTISLGVAYVGTAGRRLPSSIDPINAAIRRTCRWARRSMTNSPGMTSLDGVRLP
jgi:hypothetical protein